MSIIFLETLNIEWGQIDPKGNRRVKRMIKLPSLCSHHSLIECIEILSEFNDQPAAGTIWENVVYTSGSQPPLPVSENSSADLNTD